jgi:hypothetical protein
MCLFSDIKNFSSLRYQQVTGLSEELTPTHAKEDLAVVQGRVESIKSTAVKPLLNKGTGYSCADGVSYRVHGLARSVCSVSAVIVNYLQQLFLRTCRYSLSQRAFETFGNTCQIQYLLAVVSSSFWGPASVVSLIAGI